MTFPSFTSRSHQSELMDDLSINGAELERTLEELEFINRCSGGYPPTLDGIKQLIPPGASKVSVLDVGTGAADTPRRIIDWATARGVQAQVTGIDLSETTVAYATRRSTAYPTLQVERVNLYELPADAQYDIVHAALVLHHFPGDEAGRALAQMYRLARFGVVINDIHRHPLAWGSIRVMTAILSRNRLIRNDGPLSVLRAFTRTELEELAKALPTPEIRWWPLFRWQMVIRKATF